MTGLQVKKLTESAIIPTKGTPQAAGYDLATIEEYTLTPLERKLFKTGLSLAIPQGMYGRIAPRSGLAYKDGIDVLAGVIDEDYRGEIGVILINLGKTDKKFNVGDKIAQIIFEFYNNVEIQVVAELNQTVRGTGGFGSTTIPITNRTTTEEKPKSTQKTYESKVDLVEQWKKFGGNLGGPPTYETIVKEREKQI